GHVTGVQTCALPISISAPPAEQKLPLSSGTVQVDTPTGFDSVVMSKIRTICRLSWHSFPVVSPTNMRKSFTLLLFCPANSESGRSEERRVGKGRRSG